MTYQGLEFKHHDDSVKIAHKLPALTTDKGYAIVRLDNALQSLSNKEHRRLAKEFTLHIANYEKYKRLRPQIQNIWEGVSSRYPTQSNNAEIRKFFAKTENYLKTIVDSISISALELFFLSGDASVLDEKARSAIELLHIVNATTLHNILSNKLLPNHHFEVKEITIHASTAPAPQEPTTPKQQPQPQPTQTTMNTQKSLFNAPDPSAIANALAGMMKPTISEEAIREIVYKAIDEKAPRQLVIKNPAKATTSKPINAESFPHADMMIKAASLQINILLVGEAGTGKTTSARHILKEAFSIPDDEIGLVMCSQQLSKVELFGGLSNPATGQTIEGALSKKLIILDEVTKLNSKMAGMLNYALSDREYTCGNTNELKKMQPDAIVVATANTFGTGTSVTYNSNSKQDESLIDSRFPAKFYVSYNEKYESERINNVRLRKAFQEIRAEANRKDIKRLIDTRKLIEFDRMLSAYDDLTIPQVMELMLCSWTADERETTKADEIIAKYAKQ